MKHISTCNFFLFDSRDEEEADIKIAVNGDKINGMFEDADEVSTPTAKGLPDVIQSPDSGIHGDKSTTDITA